MSGYARSAHIEKDIFEKKELLSQSAHSFPVESLILRYRTAKTGLKIQTSISRIDKCTSSFRSSWVPELDMNHSRCCFPCPNVFHEQVIGIRALFVNGDPFEIVIARLPFEVDNCFGISVQGKSELPVSLVKELRCINATSHSHGHRGQSTTGGPQTQYCSKARFH